ncbi:MAG: hypothetical protein JRN15_15095 [Nitrososphaerota archaeon]|nr:hypothetical protein [Nitrososphaerota archaeon]
MDHGKEQYKMTHEWKVGDRFSVEGVITETADSDGDYKAIFDGHTIGGCVIAAEMACAKLIHPAAPEPQKLDVTKPVRRIWSDNTGRIVGKTLDGKRLVFEHDLGGMCIGPESDFENIPEPKIMGRREAFLGPDGELYWVSSWPGNHPIDILGRTWVEITEGDGMEES